MRPLRIPALAMRASLRAISLARVSPLEATVFALAVLIAETSSSYLGTMC